MYRECSGDVGCVGSLFEQPGVGAAERQLAREHQAGRSGADHHHVGSVHQSGMLAAQSGSPYSSNQYASLPRRLTARSRRSAVSRVLVVVTMSNSSPVWMWVSGCGTN